MNRLTAIILTIALWSCTSPAQTIDDQLKTAISNNNWFELYDLYYSIPDDNTDPYLEIFSRCLIGNRFNRQSMSIRAFEELFATHTDKLGSENLLAAAHMYARDLSRSGQNANAAKILKAAISATEKYADPNDISALKNFAEQYAALSRYNPYKHSFAKGENGKAGFTLRRVGKIEDGNVLMQFSDAKINGKGADIIFDSGAGVNIVSDSVARAYGLIPLDAETEMYGIGKRDGYYAIAKELKAGNITIEDVPFYVLDLTSGNAEADKYMNAIEFVVGSELMLALKDVTIDFERKEITVPAKAPTRSGARPNMCLSQSENLLTKGSIMGQEMLMYTDSGDGGYGSLGQEFFERNKDYITSHCTADTIRQAGIGGVVEIPCYKLKDSRLTLGGNSVTIPVIDVRASGKPSAKVLNMECAIGLKSLMLYRTVRFNMADMVFTTTPY